MSDVVGVRWTVPSTAYPVYHNFKMRLLGLTPRFNRIIEMGQLPAALCRGKQWVDTIVHDTECFHQLPDVTIFFSNSVQPSVHTDTTISQLVTNKHVLDNDVCHSTSITWSEIMESKMQNHDPIIIILILQSERDADSIPSLPDVQKNNIVCYDQSTGRSWPYSGTKLTKEEVTVDSLTLEDNGYKYLANLIQVLLERKAIHVLENISDFIRKFETNDSEQQKRSLLDESNRTQKLYLRKNYVAHELENIHDVCMREANATEHTEIDIDEALSFGSPQKKHKSNAEEIKDEKIGREIFRRCTKMLATNARCNIVVDYLSHRYGISQIYIASFLSDEDFQFEKKYMAIFEKTSIDHWLTTGKYKEDKHKMAKFFSDKCVTAFTDLLNETSTYITKKLHVIGTLQKLQFEIRALLRQTTTMLQITDMKDLAPSPPLPTELQKHILKIDTVEGCGTIYGKLTLHVKKIVPEKDKSKIEDLMTKYKYTYGYKIERIERKTIYAGGNNPCFKVGNGYKAKLTPEGKQKLTEKYPKKDIGDHSYGTVCCYVKIKKSGATGSMINCVSVGQVTDEGNTGTIEGQFEIIDDSVMTTAEENTPLDVDMETETNRRDTDGLLNPFSDVGGMQNTDTDPEQDMATSMEIEANTSDFGVDNSSRDERRLNSTEKESAQGNIETLPEGLYFLTCAHCVEFCEEKVTDQNGVDHFGHNNTNRSNLVHKGEMFDIAAVKVLDRRVSHCDTRIKSSGLFGKETTVPAELYQGQAASLEGQMIFKRGSQSGTTFGVVISRDYVTEVFEDERYDRNCNILIDTPAGGNDELESLKLDAKKMPEGDESQSGGVFSQSGDSGSAICEEISGGISISVVSILTGSVTVSTQTGQQNTVYTSCHLQKSIDELADTTDRQIILENSMCANDVL